MAPSQPSKSGLGDVGLKALISMIFARATFDTSVLNQTF